MSTTTETDHAYLYRELLRDVRSTLQNMEMLARAAQETHRELQSRGHRYNESQIIERIDNWVTASGIVEHVILDAERREAR